MGFILWTIVHSSIRVLFSHELFLHLDYFFMVWDTTNEVIGQYFDSQFIVDLL